jgi:hypothetical protein
MEKCAAHFAARVEREARPANLDQKIRRAYLLALARTPTAKEAELAQAFVHQHGLEQLCLVLLNTNEFLFVN